MPRDLRLALTLPTRDGQSLGAFMSELRQVVERRLMTMVPAMLANDSWADMESDSLAGDPASSVVGYLRCGGDRGFYRFDFSRDDSGALVLGAPVEVVREESVTYRPVAAPALQMARVLKLDVVPVHAPAAAGLIAGKPIQIMRAGPLYDCYDGEFLADVTDEFCAAMAATASASGFGIPIDFAHELIEACGGNVELFGRVSHLDARQGDGLWGTPEWTQAAADLIAARPGLLYVSPTILGQAFDPSTGEPLPGRALHSVSLTPTPRQNNMEPLALSRAATGASPRKETPMAGTQGAPTPIQGETVQLARAEHDALKLAREERDALKLERDALKAERDTAAGQVTTLAQEVADSKTRLAAIETARADEQFAAMALDVKRSGREASELVLKLAKAQPLTDARAVLMSLPVTRPLSVAGSGGNVDAETDEIKQARVVRLAREKNVTLSAAGQEVGL